jgi:hypothetical protein
MFFISEFLSVLALYTGIEPVSTKIDNLPATQLPHIAKKSGRPYKGICYRNITALRCSVPDAVKHNPRCLGIVWPSTIRIYNTKFSKYNEIF